jgi:hypothetical protein
MRFVCNNLCRPFYPYFELLGILTGLWLLSRFIRGTFDIDNSLEPVSVWHQFKILGLFTLGWWSTFLFLNKKKLSLINTGIVVGIGTILLSFHNFVSIWLYAQNPVNLRLLMEALIGGFVIYFVPIFFFGVIFQLLGAGFMWFTSLFSGEKN